MYQETYYGHHRQYGTDIDSHSYQFRCWAKPNAYQTWMKILKHSLTFNRFDGQNLKVEKAVFPYILLSKYLNKAVFLCFT